MTSEAERLANECEALAVTHGDIAAYTTMDKAAAELRLLQAENRTLRKANCDLALGAATVPGGMMLVPKPDPDMHPNNDEVICPNCCHQFRAIPVNVQAEVEALKKLCAATYQLAGLVGAPVRFLDALSSQQYSENLLPVTLDECSETKWLDAENDALRTELNVRKGDPATRLHNICQGLSEQADVSPFSLEAWNLLEAENEALRKGYDTDKIMVLADAYAHRKATIGKEGVERRGMRGIHMAILATDAARAALLAAIRGEV